LSQVTSTDKFVQFGHVFFEICERTDRKTDRHADRNTSHPFRRRSNIHRVSKNVPPFACYNLDTHKWILIFLAEIIRIK